MATDHPEPTNELVHCKNCRWGGAESTLINGQWILNGDWYCYCEGSVANGDKFDQLCPKGAISCPMFEYNPDQRHTQINVVNKYSHKPTSNDIYIGRGSILGNPYTSLRAGTTKAKFQCATREESIACFKAYLKKAIESKDPEICSELNRIWKLARAGEVNLVCFCSPKPCHGDVIRQIVKSRL